MKGWFAKHKIFASIGVIVLLIALTAGGIAAWLISRTEHNDEVEQVSYNFFQEEEATCLSNPDDVGVMITDCDSAKSYRSVSNATITNREGEYIQGTGALKIGSFFDTTVMSMYLQEADISAYEEGSIHVSVWVRDSKYLSSHMYVEFSSSGRPDQDEISWRIPASVLKPGWNDLYLGIEDAEVMGEPDLTKINYCRMYAFGVQYRFDVRIDNIYATDTAGMSLDAVGLTATTKPGYLFDADSLQGFSSNGTLILSNQEGEYKEGTGAVIISNPKVTWLTANLQPTDLTKYKDGKMSFWLYVNDASYVKDSKITLELTSSGTCDKEEINFTIQGSELKTGWNEVTLRFKKAKEGSQDKIDWTAVNYLRMFSTDADSSVILIMDGIKLLESSVTVPSDGMILNCDMTEGYSIASGNNTFSVTATSGEYKEGTGAFKSVGSHIIRTEVLMDNSVDISAYRDGGIELWIYLSTSLQTVVELTSSGANDVDEYQWAISGLKSGWNKVMLNFDNAEVRGEPNLSRIDYLRIFTPKCQEDITVIVDGVRAVGKEIQEPGVIMTCDTKLGYKSLSGESGVELTTTEGEYKVGTGAFKSEGKGKVRFVATLAEPVDISAYADGSLRFWLYIGDKSAFESNRITVELTSGGNCDVNELNWAIDFDLLDENAWNLVDFTFPSGIPMGGEIDFSAVNYLRVYTNKTETNEKALLILDHVHAVKKQIPETDVTDEPGVIWNCDSIPEHASLVTGVITEKEVRKGSGSVWTKGNADVRFTLSYEEGHELDLSRAEKIGFSVYINDTEHLSSGAKLQLEIASDGVAFANVYRFQYSLDDLKQGWNDLEFEVNGDGVNSIDWGANLSKINAIRVRVRSNSADPTSTSLVTCVDHIYMVEKEVQVACYYLQDGAIYQANKPAAIWGTADNGTEVKAELYKDGVVIAENTVTVSDGEWELTLPGQEGGYTSYSIKLYIDGNEAAEYTDILFGEVWLAAGQSNMQLKLRDSYGGLEQIAAANDSFLRIFQTVSMPDGSGARTTPASDVKGEWIQGNTTDVASVSAVAYNFAVSLRDELNVPVAILDVALGSTPIEAWLSKEMVDTNSELKAKMQALGVYKDATTFTDLGAMYYSKIAPLSHTNIKGVIWYQGESNAHRASIYAEQLDLLKEKWGDEFGFENDSMPFIFTQLAPYTFSNASDQMFLTKIMEQMSVFYSAHESTVGMVTNYDLSLRYTDTTAATAAVIHPTVKKPVGERMALAAMGLVYGGDEATAPTLESCQIANGEAILTFEHVGTGLKVSDGSLGVLGFALCDANGVWVNANAEIVDATTVRVYSNFIEEPVYVSYAYNDMNTDANLLASNGIPAAPFSTGGTGGFGSRSYLNCDGEVFVVTSFATENNEVGHGEYKNLWTVTNRSENTFDSNIRVQGVASLKSNYEAGTDDVISGIDLTEACRKYSVTSGLSNIGKLSVKMKNADARQKDVRLSLATSDGTVAYTEAQTLASEADFVTLVFDLTKLYDENGSAVANTAIICNTMTKLSFCIDDAEAGTVWIDDIKLGGIVRATEPATPGLIADCDSTPEYVTLYTGSISMEQAKKGTGSIKTAGNADVRFVMAYGSGHELDLSKADKIGFSIYINDTSALSEGGTLQLEIASDGINFTQVYRFNWSLDDLQQGWNDVEMDIVADGTNCLNWGADLSKINAIRVRVRNATENLVTYVDEIWAVENNPVLINCDSIPAYVNTNGIGEISNEQMTEGAGAFKVTGKSPIRFDMIFSDDYELDFSGHDKLCFDIYFSDMSCYPDVTADSLRIRMNSDGSDSDDFVFSIPLSEFKNGWNHVELEFDKMTTWDTTASLNNIKRLRMFTNAGDTTKYPDASLVTYVDNIRLENEETMMLANCDSKPDYVTLYTGSISTEQAKEGTGSIKTEGNADVRFVLAYNTGNELDITGYKKIGFSIYINNPEYLEAGKQLQLDVASDGINFSQVYRFNWSLDDLQQGWNDVEMDIVADGTNCLNWGANLSKINGIRVRVRGTSSTELITYIDNIHVVK